MITCQEVVDFLMAYVNQELSVEERAAFERHLSVCPPCIQFLATYRQTVQLGKTAFELPQSVPPVPESLVHAILAAKNLRKHST